MNTRSTLCTFALAAAALFTAADTVHAQYTRTVLIEEFTSATCGPCKDATPLINAVIANNPGRVVSVRYHLNIPARNDPWYKANPVHADARKDYYNVGGIPHARVDDYRSLNPTSQSDLTSAVNARLSETSPVKIEVTQTQTENTVNVQVKVTAGPAGLTGNYRLRAAAVEGHIHDETLNTDNLPGYNGEKDFHDVMRQLLPNPDGDPIQLTANQTKTFNYSYTLGNNWQPHEMFTVAWVQDEFADSEGYRVIMQSGFSAKLVGTGNAHESAAMAGYSFASVSPNPSSSEAAIGYTLGAPARVEFVLYGVDGSIALVQKEGLVEAGEQVARLDLSGLPAGVYTCTMSAGAYRATRQIVVVR